MTNKYADAINTLWCQATWWLTFLHITWIIGALVDLWSDFALGAHYGSIGEVTWGYWTIGFALVAGVLNIFVTLFCIRQIPFLRGAENDVVQSKIGRRVIKYGVLVATLLLCSPVVFYIIMMVDLNKDFIDHDTEMIMNRTLWIHAIVELIIEQVPQTLLQMFILGRTNQISPAQLFAILTSTISAACTFAGFIDLLARNRRGLFHLLTGRGSHRDVFDSPATERRRAIPGKKLKQRNKFDIKTVKRDNSPGYNSLVFLGLLVFLYILPVALLSAQFDLSPVVMLLIHAAPVLFMVATKLFGMRYQKWIYICLSLTLIAVVAVITFWYGKVTQGWFGGNRFAFPNVTNSLGAESSATTMATTMATTNETTMMTPLEKTSKEDELKITIAGIGHLWTGDISSITGAAEVFFIFIVCFSIFCFVLGVLTSDFTPLPCQREEPESDNKEDSSEMLPIKDPDQNASGRADDDDAKEKLDSEDFGGSSVRGYDEEMAGIRTEMASLNKRLILLENVIKEKEREKENEDVATLA